MILFSERVLSLPEASKLLKITEKERKREGKDEITEGLRYAHVSTTKTKYSFTN